MISQPRGIPQVSIFSVRIKITTQMIRDKIRYI